MQTPPSTLRAAVLWALRKSARWGLRLVALVAVLLVLVAVAVAALTQTNPGRAFIAEKLVDVLNESVFAGTLSVDELDGSLFGDATLRGVTLRSVDGDALATLDECDVEFRLRPLSQQRVEVERLELRGLSVSGTIQPDGSVDLSGVLAESDSPPSDGPGWAVLIQQAQLSDGQFVLRDARNDNARVVRAEDIELLGEFALDADGAMRVSIAGIETRVAGPVDLERFAAIGLHQSEITLDGDALGVRVSSLTVADTEVQGFEADITLAAAESSAPFAYLDVTLPEFVLAPADANLWLGQDVLQVPLTVAATIEGPADGVEISLPVSGPEGSIGATLTLDLTDPTTPGYQGRIRLVRVQPGEWLDLGELDADVSAGIYVNGQGITPADLQLSLRIDMGPSRVGEFALDEAYFSVGYQDETLTIGDVEIRSRGATVDLDGELARSGSVLLNARVNVPDLASLAALDVGVPPMQGSVRAELVVEGNAPIEAWISGELPSTVEDVQAALGPLTLAAELAVRDFDGMGVLVERADVELAVSGSATAPIVSATVSAREVLAADMRVASADGTFGWENETLTSDLQTSLPGLAELIRLRATSRVTDETITSRFSRLEVVRDGLRFAVTDPVSVVVEHEAFAPSRVAVNGLRLDMLGGRVVASGWYALSSGAFDGTVDVTGASLSDVAELASAEVDLTGQVSASLAARGTLARPVIELSASVEEVDAFGVDNLSAAATVRYEASTLTADATLAQDAERLLLVDALTLPLSLDLSRGAYALAESEPWSGRFVLSDFDVALLSAFSPQAAELGADGRLDATIQVAGTPSEPSALIAAEARSVRATVALEDQPDLSVRDGGAVLEGAVESTDEGVARVDLRLAVSSAGVQMANATVRGDIDVAAIQAGTYELDEQRFQASASLARVEFDALPEFLRETLPIDAGWFELSGIWNGTLSEPTAKANVSVGDVVVGELGPFSGNAVVMAGDAISLTSRITRTGERAPLADASALLSQSLRELLSDGLDARAALTANAAIAPLELRVFAPLDPALAETEGEVEARFSLGGSLLGPQLEGFAAMRDLRLVNGRTGTLRVDAEYSGVDTAVSASITTDGEVVCTATAQVSALLERDGSELVRTAWQDWPITADVSADETPLAFLLPTFAFGSLLESVEGVANIDLAARGTLGDPALTGTLQVSDANLSVIPLQRRFERLGLTMTFSGAEAVIEEFSVGDSDGRAMASGRVLFDGLLPQEYELDLRFRDLFVADPAGSGVNLRGDVGISGIFSDSDHQTNVLIDGMRVTVPDVTSSDTGPTSLPDSILFVGEDVMSAHVGEREPPRIGARESASAIDLPWVISIVTVGENEVLQTYVTASFDIDVVARIVEGTVTATGEIPITEGQISVVGKTFDITRGVIRLPEGARELDPLVDIEAVHVLPANVSEMLATEVGPPSGDSATIRLRVTGLLSELQADQENAIELYSDPPMGEADVFMVLATGRLSEDGNSAEAEQGVEALSNLLAGFFSDRISQSLFIDTLSFETTSESQRVEGGKYISDNLYISGTYIRTPDENDDNNVEVALQWILRRIGQGSLRVELRGGDRAKGGLELLYQVVRRARGQRAARRAAAEADPE